MANICDSRYKITGETAEVTALYNLMNNMKVSKTNGNWVGHIVEALNDGVIPDYMYVRGWWDELQLEDNCIIFNMESAWQSLHETWDFICSKYESLLAFFIAEEPGCEIYVKRDNDTHDFPANYYVDALPPKGDFHSEYFDTIDEAFRYVGKIADTNIITADDIVALNSKWQEEDSDSYIYLHEFKEV